MKKKDLIYLLIIICFLPQMAFSQIVTKDEKQVPTARIYHSLVYDDNSECLVLFPGFVQHGWSKDLITNDLWIFDIHNNKWTYKGLCFTDTTDNRPSFTTIAYDVESDRFITFDTDGRTWSFDLKANKWTEMYPENAPSARCGQGMSYDEESDRVIIFGGFGCKGVNDPIFSDTWAYDYNTNTWTKMSPDNDPSERIYFAMTYDNLNDQIVLWGGRKIEPISDNKIWTYDFNNDVWESYYTDDGPAKPLAYPAMVYREKTEDIFIFGGGDLISPFVGKTTDESWSYTLKNKKWKKISSQTKPPSLANTSLSYDKINDRTILFGGELDSLYSDKISSETWIYDSFKSNWINNK